MGSSWGDPVGYFRVNVLGSENVLEGSQDWTTLQLAAGNPENTFHEYTTKLQLDVRGEGTVWVDDVRLAIRQAR